MKEAGEKTAAYVRGHLKKADSDDEAEADNISLAVDLSAIDALATSVPNILSEVHADTSTLVLEQLDVGNTDAIVDQVNDRAVDFAKKRGAEMVGKRWKGDELIDNPNADWAITDTTRDEIKAIIYNGLQDNIGTDAIAENIQDATAFSEDRAQIIAYTEVGNANSQGALDGMRIARGAGVKLQKEWVTDEDPCEDCEENADAGPIDLEDDFPSGDDAPLAHPNCECVLLSVLEDDEGNEEEEDEE